MTLPLQGALNAFIYIRPRYRELTREGGPLYFGKLRRFHIGNGNSVTTAREQEDVDCDANGIIAEQVQPDRVVQAVEPQPPVNK